MELIRYRLKRPDFVTLSSKTKSTQRTLVMGEIAMRAGLCYFVQWKSAICSVDGLMIGHDIEFLRLFLRNKSFCGQ